MTNIKKKLYQYSLLIAVFQLLAKLIFYLLGKFANNITNYTLYFICTIGIIFYYLINKKIKSRFIDKLKNGIRISLGLSLFSSIGYAILLVLFRDDIISQTIDVMRKQLKNSNFSQDLIENSISFTKSTLIPLAVLGLFIFNFIIGAITSLICSYIFNFYKYE